MKRMNFDEVKDVSIDFGDIQYWIALNDKYFQKEIVKTENGYFHNFDEEIYKLVWEEWEYFGPLDLEKIIDETLL